jgi:DNA-binding Xre family transcriptional regulator
MIRAMKLNSVKIEEERARRKLNKTEFSRLIGMSVSAYCRMIEGNKTKITTITRIANALHYDPKDLLIN